MILVDTAVWVDHLRGVNAKLAELLEQRRVEMHPFVLGELALGNLRSGGEALHELQLLPRPIVASDFEVLALIWRRALSGRGIGYVDAHLLASATMAPGYQIWTFDRRLAAVAQELGVGFTPA